MAAVAKVAAVGWRVRVFWEGDDEWFEGVVTAYTPETGYFVAYDDGEQQWEVEDATRIQFLYETEADAAADETTQLILNAEAEVADQPVNKWSVQPPPSTTEHDYDDGYEQDDYEADHDPEEEEVGKPRGAGSPTPEEESEKEQEVKAVVKREHKPSSPKQTRPALRDRTKCLKSGVFFRDPETLRETKHALLKEKYELVQQYEQLAVQLTQKEQRSQSLKHQLHGLKAQVTVASLKGPACNSTEQIPKTVKGWADRVLTQKAANRSMRQQLSGRHTQVTQVQTTLQQMEKQKHQLEATLLRVPRKELRSLVEIQVEIAQVTAEKRDLEAQMAKSLVTDRAKTKGDRTNGTSSSSISQNQRDVKTELEKELRQVDKTLMRVQDQVDEWKLNYEKENAKITPLRTRIKQLQTDLYTYERSHVLLRSVFMRLDRAGHGTIPLDAAVEALVLLMSRDDKMSSKQELLKRLPGTTPASLDFSAFTVCFGLLVSQS